MKKYQLGQPISPNEENLPTGAALGGIFLCSAFLFPTVAPLIYRMKEIQI